MSEMSDEGCGILQLPMELLWAIFRTVVHTEPSSPRDLAAWCLTCSTFNDLCDDEVRYQYRCFATCPVLFGLGLSPLFGGPLVAISQPEADPTEPPTEAEEGEAEPFNIRGPDELSSPQGQPKRPNDSSSASQAAGAYQPLEKLTWKLRTQLLPHLPQRLNAGRVLSSDFPPSSDELEARECTDKETGRLHTNCVGSYCNLIADHPFLCTNQEALSSAWKAVNDHLSEEEAVAREREFLQRVMFRGVDYFEMTVVHNTKSWNRAAAIAISQWFQNMSFVGWTRDSIAYHSDDATIRGGEEHFVDVFAPFSTGDVVGCGVDWDNSDVFFVLMSAPTAPRVRISKRVLQRTAWYPAIASMMRGDVLRANFGQEPFVFDIKAFVQKKQANQLDTLSDVRVERYVPRGNQWSIPV